MKFSRSWQLVVAVIVCCLFAAPKGAKADSYRIYNLGNSGAVSFYGMDDAGNVVLDHFGGLFPCPDICYVLYTNGVRVPGSPTPAPPPLSYDNGTPCTPAVPVGASVIRGVCNNGRDAFTGKLTPDQHFPNVYTGSLSDISFVASGGEGFLFMNGVGDIVFEDNFTENWYQAVRDPSAVPEPSTMMLLGTGVLACVGVVRRRLFSRA